MHASKFTDVLMGIVFVALVTTIVAHPHTSTDITAAGNAFSKSITAAIRG